MAVDERFWSRVDKTDTCWLWTHAQNAKGYGFFSIGGKNYMAHRIAYEMVVGPIPEGLHLDHLCRVKHCVNPAHLEPVSNYTNHHRWMTEVKTHCVHGHKYTPENTILRNEKGWRLCRTCKQGK